VGKIQADYYTAAGAQKSAAVPALRFEDFFPAQCVIVKLRLTISLLSIARLTYSKKSAAQNQDEAAPLPGKIPPALFVVFCQRRGKQHSRSQTLIFEL